MSWEFGEDSGYRDEKHLEVSEILVGNQCGVNLDCKDMDEGEGELNNSQTIQHQ